MYTLTWSLVPSINYIYIKLQGKVLQWIMSVRYAHTGPEYRARFVCRGIYSETPKRFYLATMTTQSKFSPFPPPHMTYRSYEMEQGFNCAIATAILTFLWTPLPFAPLPIICLHLFYHYCPFCWGPCRQAQLWVCMCMLGWHYSL